MTYSNSNSNNNDIYAAKSDDFWKIACMYDSDCPKNEIVVLDHADDTTDDNSKDFCSKTSSTVFYQLHIAPYGRVDLNLTPIVSLSLPSSSNMMHTHNNNNNDTVTHILGANVWFGSAILSAMFQQLTIVPVNKECTQENVIQSHLNRFHNNATINVLELGSGAVGLTGIVVGLSISGYIEMIDVQNQNDTDCYTRKKQQKKCRMILTDHDPNVIQQLQCNIQSTIVQLQNQFPSHTILPEFIVQDLDWNDDTFVLNANNVETSSDCTSSNIGHHKNIEQQQQQCLQLVVGAELVYNNETADACIHIVLQLLQKHFNVLIVLVQLSDRDGWNTIFIPTLLKYQQQAAGRQQSSLSPKTSICIKIESSIIQPDIYDLACQLVPPGGTLNPLSDYTICYIWNGIETNL
jgi:hypothetical protein